MMFGNDSGHLLQGLANQPRVRYREPPKCRQQRHDAIRQANQWQKRAQALQAELEQTRAQLRQAQIERDKALKQNTQLEVNERTYQTSRDAWLAVVRELIDSGETTVARTEVNARQRRHLANEEERAGVPACYRNGDPNAVAEK